MAVQLLSNVRDLPHVASSFAAVVGTEYGPTDDFHRMGHTPIRLSRLCRLRLGVVPDPSRAGSESCLIRVVPDPCREVDRRTLRVSKK
jgi:hypothetical protein